MQPHKYPERSVAWTGVVILSSLYAFSFIDRGVLNLLVDPVSKALHIGDIQMSFLIGGSFAIIYGLLGLPLAHLADITNRRRIILAGAFLWGISTFLCGFANTFWALVICRMGLAVGEAALSPAAYSLLADWFPPGGRTLPSAVYTWSGGFGARVGGIGLGVLILYIVERRSLSHTPFLSAFQPWQLMFFVVALPTLLLALLFLFTGREPTRELGSAHPEEGAKLGEAFSHIQANPALYGALLAGTGMNNLATAALGAWAPQIIKRNYGWPISKAAVVLGTVGLVSSVIGAILLPMLYDWIRVRLRRPDLPIALSVALSVTGCWIIAAAPMMPNAYLLVLCDFVGGSLAVASAMLSNISLPVIAPPRMRAILISIYLLMCSAVTATFAPTIAAVLSTYVFADQGARALGMGASTVAALTPLLTVSLLLPARRAFGRAISASLPPPPAARPAPAMA